MTKKTYLAAPLLVLLAACGGGSTNPTTTPPRTTDAPNLTGAPAGSVVLSADTPAEASSIDEVLSVNFTDSPVGSSVKITEGDFAGISLTKAEPISGKETIFLSTPDNVALSSALVGSLMDDFQVTIQFIGIDGTEDYRAETVNGTSIFFWKETNSLDTTAREYNEVGIGNSDKGVNATVVATELGGETTLVLGSRRYFEGVGATDDYQEKATGTYDYGGLAIVFNVYDSYTTETASMTVDFEQGSGTFNAADFTPDEGAASKTITISSVLSLDNSTGFISSTSGTLTVGTDSGSVAVNGVLSENNDAVAGVLVPTEVVGGIVGGLFVLPQNP